MLSKENGCFQIPNSESFQSVTNQTRPLNIFKLLMLRETTPNYKFGRKRFLHDQNNSSKTLFGFDPIDASFAIPLWVEEDSLKNCSAHYCPLHPSPRSTIAAAFSIDGNTLASTHGDHTVKIICSQTGQCLKNLTGHRRTPWVVRYHPKTKNILASGSLDHEVRLWDATIADCIAAYDFYRPIASLAFHANGEILAVSSGHKLYIWKYKEKGTDSSPKIVLRTKRSLRAVHFHPHGAPLLLTAEVNDLDATDCPPTIALSRGYIYNPPPTIHFTPNSFANSSENNITIPPFADTSASSDPPVYFLANWLWPVFANGQSPSQNAILRNSQPSSPPHDANTDMEVTSLDNSMRTSLPVAPISETIQNEEHMNMSLVPSHQPPAPSIPQSEIVSLSAQGLHHQKAISENFISGTRINPQNKFLQNNQQPINDESALPSRHNTSSRDLFNNFETQNPGSTPLSLQSVPRNLGLELTFSENLIRSETTTENALAFSVSNPLLQSIPFTPIHAAADSCITYQSNSDSEFKPSVSLDDRQGLIANSTTIPHANNSEPIEPQLFNNFTNADLASHTNRSGENGLVTAADVMGIPRNSTVEVSVSTAARVNNPPHVSASGPVNFPSRRRNFSSNQVGLNYRLRVRPDPTLASEPNQRVDDTMGNFLNQTPQNDPEPGTGTGNHLVPQMVPLSDYIGWELPFLQGWVQGQAQVGNSGTAAPELPCTVKLKLWSHIAAKPNATLNPEMCKLTIPHAVLCSEMGAHFSPCGRYLAACVACVLPHNENDSQEPASRSFFHRANNRPSASPTQHPPALAQNVIYELRIYSLEESTFGEVLASRAVRAAHCLTSIQFSPSSSYILLAYGRRHHSLLRSLISDSSSVIPVYTVLEIYRVSDMSLVRVLPSAEDEVNVACFHPKIGGGLIYGTKEGKLRIIKHDRNPSGKNEPNEYSINDVLEAEYLDPTNFATDFPPHNMNQ